MAEKITPPRAAIPRWRLALVLAAAVLAGAVLALRPSPAAHEPLPAPPNLAGKPAELRDRLAAAWARAREAGAPPGAIADLGRLYHINGFNAEAAGCWRRLRSAEPREPRWPYYLADLARLAADADGQRQWLERTVALAPAYAPAWLALGELAFKSAQLEAAERAYRRRLELLPNDPYAALGLARIAQQRGARAEGRRKLEALLQATPNFASARNLLAELLAQDGDAAGATQQRSLGAAAGRFRAADDPWMDELRPYCCDPDLLIVWGETDFQTKHGDLGRGALERALALAPADRRTNEMLGRFYLDIGEPARARDLLETRCQSPAASEFALAELSEAYMALDQSALALQTADRGLARIPDSASLCNARGLALASAGRYEEAAAAYRAAIARAPGTSSAPANLGLLMLLLGRKDEARAQLEYALRLQPGNSKALIALATLELESGRLETAAQYVVPYFQQSPGTETAQALVTRYHVALALAATQRGDPAGVVRAYRAGLTLVPGSAELHGLLGLHYLRARQLPEALETLEAAYRLKPDDPRVLALLGQLYAQLGRLADARKILGEGAEQARLRGDDATARRFAALLAKLPR